MAWYLIIPTKGIDQSTYDNFKASRWNSPWQSPWTSWMEREIRITSFFLVVYFIPLFIGFQYPWQIHGAAICANIYHQYNPVMWALIYQHHGSYGVLPYGSKHCLRRYLSLQIIVNYIPLFIGFQYVSIIRLVQDFWTIPDVQWSERHRKMLKEELWREGDTWTSSSRIETSRDDDLAPSWKNHRGVVPVIWINSD